MPKVKPKSERMAGKEPSRPNAGSSAEASSCGTVSEDEISYYSDTEIPNIPNRPDNGLFVKRVTSVDPDYNGAEDVSDVDDHDDNGRKCREPEKNLHNGRPSTNPGADQNVEQTVIDDERRSSKSSGKLLEQISKTLLKVKEQEVKKKKDSSAYLEKPNKKELMINDNNALAPAKYIPPVIEIEQKLEEKPCQTFKMNLFQCVENATRRLLWGLGEQMSKIPVFLIIIPLLACALAMVGVIVRRQNLNFRPPFDSYYSLEESVDLTETREALFNDSNGRFDAMQRMSGLDFSVILKSTDHGNILKEDFFDGYLTLKKRIEDIKVIGTGKIYKYSTLCRHSQDTCEMDVVQAIMNSGKNIKFFYPEMDVPRPNKNSTLVFLGNTFGGVETDQDGAIAKAQSLAMYFKLKRNSNEGDDQTNLVRQWDDSFRNVVSKEDAAFKQMNFSWWSYGEFVKAVVDTFRSIYLYLGVSLGIICVGCVAACFCIYGLDCRSWSVMGFVATLVIFCTIGSAISADIGITGSLNSATFPTYFMIAASCMFSLITIMQSWRKYNNITINPSEKLRFILCWEGSCFTLICIILAAAAGIVAVSTSTPLFRSVCQLIGFGYCLLLILVLFFFNCLLFLCGKHEIFDSKCKMDEKGAGLFATPILKRYSMRDMDLLHSKFLDKSPCISRKVGEFLSSVHMRYVTVIVFCVYLIFAAWGCSLVPIQLNERHYLRVSNDLEMNSFLNDYDRYYSRYDNYIELIFGNPIDYYSPKVRTSVNDILSWVDFEQHLSENVVSWLRDFIEFEKSSIYLINRDTFVPVVDLIFLRDPRYKRYINDIAMGKYNEQIVGSRMYVELNKIGLNRQLEIIKYIAARAKENNLPLSIKAPSIFLLQHDIELQMQMILSFAVMICVISLGSLIAFAQPLLSLITSLCTVSTTVGTIGFAALWNVPLNAVNEATVLSGISYTTVLCITCCHYFNNAKFAGAKDRLIYTFQSVFYACLWSGGVVVASFLPLLIVDCELIVHQSKIIFFHCAFSVLHCFIFLPPLLILCSTSAPVFCRALKEMCEESCCCCDTEEDATSIYYIPTGGRSLDPHCVQQFFQMKFREDINTPQPQLPAPPRREMILPPPSCNKQNGRPRSSYPPPDVAAGPGHYHGQKQSYPNSRNPSRRNSFRDEDAQPQSRLYRYGGEVQERPRDSQRDNRGRSRRRCSVSPSGGREFEAEDRPRRNPQKKVSRSISPSLRDHALKRNEETYSEPSDPENVQEPSDHRRRRSRRRNQSEDTSIDASCTIDDSQVDNSEVIDDGSDVEDAKPKSKISYAKWTKEIPVNAYTTERVTAEKYTIEGDGNRLELPPDWKRFWLNGNLRQAKGGKMPPNVDSNGIGMTPVSDHHRPMHPHPQMPMPSHYPYQSPHAAPGPEFYHGERPRVYNGPSRGGSGRQFVHPSTQQFPPRAPMQPSGNYRKPAHW